LSYECVARLRGERLWAVSASRDQGPENIPVVGLDIAGIVAASWGRTERKEVSA
jgi:hypothetical protein